MSRRQYGAIALLLGLIVIAGCTGTSPQAWLAGLMARSQPEASHWLEASGTMEAREVRVVAELGGRVVEIASDEGDMVKQGQMLVRLDEADLAAQTAQAQAALKVAETELARSQATARPEEVTAAQAARQQAVVQAQGRWQDWQDAIRLRDNPQELSLAIAEAQTALTLAQQDTEGARAEVESARQSRDRVAWASVEYRIAQKGVEAAEEALKGAQATEAGAQARLTALQAMRDKPLALEAQAHAAEAAYRLAQADITVAEARLAAVEAPPLAEDVAIAQARVHQAAAALRTLEVMREKMALRAPSDGLISSRAVEVGEMAIPGAPLLTIADLSEVTLTIYVPETQIGRLRLGQEAVVTVDAYPDQGLAGHVTYIADQAEFTPRNVQTKEERVNTVFAVEITLPNPEQRLKPGMPADAWIRLE